MTAQIVNLVQIAREEGDYVGEQFLGWFLDEQREEVASMSTLLAVIDRAGIENMLLVEDYLGRAAGAAAAPGAPEPPAAGGALDGLSTASGQPPRPGERGGARGECRRDEERRRAGPSGDGASGERARREQLDAGGEEGGFREPGPPRIERQSCFGRGPGGHHTQRDSESSFPMCPSVTPPAQPRSRRTTSGGRDRCAA